MLTEDLKYGQSVKKNVFIVSSDRQISATATTMSTLLNLDSLDGQEIVVTHIETPEKFFSRLVSCENNFSRMNELIWERVRSPFAEDIDRQSLRPDLHLLAFSTIHQIWCRCRVEEVPHALTVRDRKGVRQKPSVKVRLIDFGSLEVVALDNLRLTTDQIVEYNFGQSFCFECRLSLIKPFSETEEWSSYANFLFEKQAKDKVVTLRQDECRDGVVVCDLEINWANDSRSCKSLSDFLVQTRVARYRMGHDFYHRNIAIAGEEGMFPRDEDFEYQSSDDEIDVIDAEDDNKLYYI